MKQVENIQPKMSHCTGPQVYLKLSSDRGWLNNAFLLVKVKDKIYCGICTCFFHTDVTYSAPDKGGVFIKQAGVKF